MNEIQKYENMALGVSLLIATDAHGKRWFVAKQIADALGYENPSKAYVKCKNFLSPDSGDTFADLLALLELAQ